MPLTSLPISVNLKVEKVVQMSSDSILARSTCAVEEEEEDEEEEMTSAHKGKSAHLSGL